VSEATRERLQRALDVTVAGGALAILAVPLGILALAVRLTSAGPALFRQWRIGQGGRPFRLLKLRTMVHGAAAQGPAITARGDARVTPLGAWLRRWKLDELPQLVNVLRGDMSLVGPRPEVRRYVARYGMRERRLLRVRPGITDPASIAFADEESILAACPDRERAYVETVLPQKIALSLAYLEQRSVWSDLGVIARTVGRLVR
jgi:lipopolysaccharide/colanic/teichoic acid biosynthesis glycosyltransferase